MSPPRRGGDAIAVMRDIYRLDRADDAWTRGLEEHGIALGDPSLVARPAVVGHLDVALRLRRHVAEALRAEGDPRALREAIVRGGSPSLAPSDTPAFWPALMGGALSIVDRWDAGGARYVLVARCRAELRDPRALTAKEELVARGLVAGSSVKVIAFDAEVAVSTVTTLASRIYRKLGVDRRAALVRLARVSLAEAVYAPLGLDGTWLVVEEAAARPSIPTAMSPALVDVLERLAAGQTSGEIASARGTARSTIDKQISRVYAILRVRSRGELSAWWATRGGAEPIAVDRLG